MQSEAGTAVSHKGSYVNLGGGFKVDISGRAANARIPISAPSLGGVETLVTRPATTSHSGMSAEDRWRLGITDRLIRLSVGIEATDDIVQDFDRALAS